MKLKPEFNRFNAFIFDCDGTLWIGENPIPGALEAVEKLRELGKIVLYATNNSTLSRKGYLAKVRKLGFTAKIQEIYCSSYVAAMLMKNLGLRDVFPLGEKGLIEELMKVGLRVLDIESDETAEGVLVGLDRRLTYRKLQYAFRHILKGALFIATNKDPTLPMEDGFTPGAGAIVAALETALGRSVDILVGKPSPYLFIEAMKEWKLDSSEVLVIGDRLDTDIEGARRARLASALVATGVTQPAEISLSKVKPSYVLSTLLEIFE
ncbi:MAG: HAD-IIA family hydrolase [Thermofilaceae archaeon]